MAVYINVTICRTLVFLFFVAFGIFLTYDKVQDQISKPVFLETVDSFEDFEESESRSECANISNSRESYSDRVFSPRPVIVVTYGRSGSSFFGNILKLDKSVFYIFEPLHFLKTEYKTLHLVNGEKRSFDSFLMAAEYILMTALKCQFKMIPLEYWNGMFNSEKQNGYQLVKFYSENWDQILNRYNDRYVFGKALERLEAQCLNSYAVIIKTIRLPLFLLSTMIDTVKNIKVIHLVRDPRPTISSQRVVFDRRKGLGSETVALHARNFCARVYHDIITFDVFLLYYPEKLLRVRYEDLATNSTFMSKNLYGFLNLTFNENIAKAVLDMTSPNKSVNYEIYGTIKQNSKTFIDIWRTQVPSNFVSDVDDHCLNVYSRIGYKPASSFTILRNVSIPLYIKYFDDIQHLRFGLEIPV